MRSTRCCACYDTHDLTEVQVFDQLFATRCGKGMLMVSSLDHSTPAGQWVLGELISYRQLPGWASSDGRWNAKAAPGSRCSSFPDHP